MIKRIPGHLHDLGWSDLSSPYDEAVEPEPSSEDLQPEEWQAMVAFFRRETILGKLHEIATKVDGLYDHVGSSGRIVPVQHIEAPGVHLIRPFLAVVTPYEGEYLSQFVECNINASGATLFEAIENLKDMVVTTYTALSALAAERLGPVPTKQLAILRAFLETVR